MNTITWHPTYSVGIASLDEQHTKVVRLINELIAASHATVRSEIISEALTKLTSYATEHFKAEEEILEKHGYPGLAEQKEDHKAYRLKIVALCQETMVHDESVPAALLEFLREWWVAHILESDMQYRSFLMERGVK